MRFGLSAGMGLFGVAGMIACAAIAGRGGDTEAGKIDLAIEMLETTQQGAALIREAQRSWGAAEMLSRRLKAGKISKTDAVITRHYDVASGNESRRREVTVHLRTDQPVEAVALDLAHELSHAVSRTELDPYDPELTAVDYIYAAIEGKGGEVEALISECKVALELSALGRAMPMDRCEKYMLDDRKSLDLAAIRRDFYKVGSWKGELFRRLGADARQRFPLLSGERPELFSSTGAAPYPVALLEEYEIMSRAACGNTRKRLQSQRTPAGEKLASTQQLFLLKRCQNADKG